MDLADRVSESLIKIFHNAKGSIVNDVARWTEDLDTEHQVKSTSLMDEQTAILEKDLHGDEHEEQYEAFIPH